MKVLTISGHQIEESVDSRGVQESESTELGDNDDIRCFIFTTCSSGPSENASFRAGQFPSQVASLKENKFNIRNV